MAHKGSGDSCLLSIHHSNSGAGCAQCVPAASANQANRSLVRGRGFPLATVRGVEPNKAGQPGCSVLLREREDRSWLLFGAEFVTESSVVWDGGVSGVRYGTDSPTGEVDDTPNAMLQPDGSLVLR
jgi:hypothetical protein